MSLNQAAGIGGMLKDGTTLAEGVDEAILRNIAATRQLMTIVRTSIGPTGLKKLIINHLGKTLVSSDCATIVRELEVVHPAAKMIALAAEAQDTEVGDGTNLVVSFAGELLKLAEELLRTGLHTSEIVAGYELAYKKCVEILPTLQCGEVSDVRDPLELAKVLAPVLAAKHGGIEETLAPLVARACIDIMPAAPEIPTLKADQIRMAKIRGGDIRNSTVMKGMVCGRDTETSIKTLKDAKVAVFNCGLEMAQTETKGTVLIRTAEELLNYNKSEERALEEIIKAIHACGAKLVIVGGSISEMALHFLEKYQLMALKIVSKWELRRLCGATGATALVRLGPATPEELGFISSASVREVGGKMITVLEQAPGHSSKIATIVLRASTDSLLNDVERAIDDAVHAVRAVCKHPGLVHGAGACELELARQIMAYGNGRAGLEQYAIKKFAEAFEIIPRTLSENSGLDATLMLAKLRAAHAAGDVSAGVNVYAQSVDEAADPAAAPVYDILHVKESALRLAVDAAITVLRVDQIIMSKPAGGPKPPK